ncbi:MAG: amidohydrolase family protein [Pyrinomonadaceae bacterium]
MSTLMPERALKLAAVISLCAAITSLLFGMATAAETVAVAQAGESGTYILYKYQRRIGEERFEIRPEGESLLLTSNFELTFVGDKVPLAASLRVRRDDLTPRSFEIKGRTSTRSDVDLAIEIDGTTATIRERGASRVVAVPARFFTTSGLVPVAQQTMLFRYWQQRHPKGRLPLLPGGGASFTLLGRDRVNVGGTTHELERYSIEGVAWGRFVAWFDRAQSLVALVGADAEMDRFEAVRGGFEPALPLFVAKGAEEASAQLAALKREIEPVRQGRYAVVGGLLVDGTERAPVPDSVVLLENGRVLAAGPRAKVKVPRGWAVFDARGKTLLPGLWDMHAHATQAEWFPASLAAGVTTMRDAANELEFIAPIRDAIRQGRALGPRLLLAGYVDSGPDALGSATAETPEAARALVQAYHRAGFEQIKIYQSLRPELVPVVAAEAHRLGLTVTGHVPTGMNVFQAVEAGMDQINHVSFLFRLLRPRDFRPQPGVQPPLPFDPQAPEARANIEFVKRSGTVVEPTLARGELNLFPRDKSFASVEPGMEKLPYQLSSVISSMGVPPEVGARARASMELSLKLTLALHRAGVPLLVGTDLVAPGHTEFRELELLVQAGLTPLAAIQAATIVPARVMKLDRELGTIEPGKRADLIVVDGNPLESISHIRRTQYVVTGGVMYECARLWQSAGLRP